MHFLLIGAGLFLLFGWRGNPASVPGGRIPLWSHHLYTNARDYYEWGAKNRLEGSAVYVTAAVDF